MFADVLKKLRKEHKLTQKQLADKLFIDQTAVSYWENGKTKPDFEKQQALADLFGVSIDYLTGRENETPQSEKKKLTKEEKDIEKIIDNAINSLSGTDGLMFDGEVPATEEEIEQLKNLMRIGVAAAKQRAKEKFTPKKYRK